MTSTLRARQLVAHLASASATARISRMASASILALDPQQHPSAFSTPPPDAAAASKASELLQLNHERFHMYFNSSGFHSEFQDPSLEADMLTIRSLQTISLTTCWLSMPSMRRPR